MQIETEMENESKMEERASGGWCYESWLWNRQGTGEDPERRFMYEGCRREDKAA